MSLIINYTIKESCIHNETRSKISNRSSAGSVAIVSFCLFFEFFVKNDVQVHTNSAEYSTPRLFIRAISNPMKIVGDKWHKKYQCHFRVIELPEPLLWCRCHGDVNWQRAQPGRPVSQSKRICTFKMSLSTPMKEAIKQWELKNDQKVNQATEIKLNGILPPLDKMDPSLLSFHNCE